MKAKRYAEKPRTRLENYVLRKVSRYTIIPGTIEAFAKRGTNRTENVFFIEIK